MKIKTDMLLAHAPAFFDFRNRSDVYFPFLGTSGDVPITPLYEYFPLGFKTLQRSLSAAGYDVEIVNLATVLLKYPQIDLDRFLGDIEARIFGIDLHWMVHVQGALGIASLLKKLHPETPVVLGGISSTYYAQQLIQRPEIDMVMRGYDTHAPMETLLGALGNSQELARVPNLLWKSRDGEIQDNGFGHTPASFSCGVNWSTLPQQRDDGGLPILEVLSTQNAGCPFNCGWCGGSRDAFRRINGMHKPIVRKPMEEVEYEMRSMQSMPDADRYHLYTIGAYTEPKDRLTHLMENIGMSGVKSVSYEQFHLTPDDVMRDMVRANPNTIITLSPESHDMRISKLAGRGTYTPQQMEEWIERALDLGIHQIDIWYFIGMPEQDKASVEATVAYCGHLLRRFKGKRVVPLLCPMIPFLDPASNFFEHPDKHGYKIFHRTVEEHRSGMENASIINRVNYETKWLSRSDLVHLGYSSVRKLTELKMEYGQYPRGIGEDVCNRIDDAARFVDVVHEIDCIADPKQRARELAGIGDDILSRNNEIFFNGVANQSFPVERDVGGRWFDEMLSAEAHAKKLETS
ncbi:cobalamin-dependent protein [Planktotalea sp.]|uniref:B12-binding domain-containing radical SAM protein n=1 Tax=Planktotalea sp. TaxID=2029877 RepID=UPI003297B637